MLNRPRYPVMEHPGHPTARNRVAPAGMKRAMRSGTGSSLGWRQTLQSRRMSRCATTPRSAEAILYGSIPMSTRRVTALGASLVCRVESTRCPVSDAWSAICAVSWSRISPTSTTSGSWRRIERSAEANVRPALSCTWTWTMFCPSRYSTGSSTVTMLTPSFWTRRSAE